MNKSKLRITFEVVFLLLFTFLFIQGKLKLWVLFWVSGILISFLFSRVYCGWSCPIGSLMRLQSWFYKKFNWNRLNISASRSVSIIRYFLLIIFITGMIAVRVGDFKLNIILYLVISGVILSFFFEENLWHRVCPHGTVLSITNRTAIWGMEITEEKCTGCGLCEKVCPNYSIGTGKNNIRKIDNNECLICHKCEKVCPADAIKYNKHTKNVEKNLKV